MTFLTCSLYLLLVVLTGYVVVSLTHPSSRFSVVELAALSAAVGAGTMGLLLFWFSLAGFVPSRKVLAIIGAVTAIVLAMLWRKKRMVLVEVWPGDLHKNDRWIVAPLILAAAGLAVVLAGAVSSPLVDWDAFAIWGLKAKVLALQPLRPAPEYFHDLTLSYSHLDYPLMVPFLTAGAYAAMGSVDDQTGKLVSVFLDFLVVPMVYLGLRWKLRRLPAACLASVVAVLPAMLQYAGVGCADLPLAMFYAGSVVYLVRWIGERRQENLVLAILFSAFMAFTKNEGVALALINGLVILGFSCFETRSRTWTGAAIFFLGVLAIDSAWLAWSSGLPRTHEDYGSKFMSASLVTNLPRLKEIIPGMAGRVVEMDVWGLIWIAAAAMALLGWRAFAQKHVLAMWILVALHLTSYVLAYVVTPWKVSDLIAMTADRLLLHTIPAVMLLAGWHWAEIGAGPGHPQ